MLHRLLIATCTLTLASCGGIAAVDLAAKHTEEQLSAAIYCELVLDGGLGTRAEARALHADIMGELRRAKQTDAGDDIVCPAGAR